MTRKVEDDELTDTPKAMVAPLRPYGCVFAYSGGAQKSLRGNYHVEPNGIVLHVM